MRFTAKAIVFLSVLSSFYLQAKAQDANPPVSGGSSTVFIFTDPSYFNNPVMTREVNYGDYTQDYFQETDIEDNGHGLKMIADVAKCVPYDFGWGHTCEGIENKHGAYRVALASLDQSSRFKKINLHLMLPTVINQRIAVGMELTLENPAGDDLATINCTSSMGVILLNSNKLEIDLSTFIGHELDVEIKCNKNLKKIIYESFGKFPGVTSSSNHYLVLGNPILLKSLKIDSSNLNLAVGQITVNPTNTNIADDGLPAVTPAKPFEVDVDIAGTGFLTPENRSTVLSLKIGSQLLQQQVSLAGLSSTGTMRVPFLVNLTADDNGDQNITATINPTEALDEKESVDNTATIPVHVLCDVADWKVDVPFFAQGQSPWGKTQYAHSVHGTLTSSGKPDPKKGQPKTMADLGCLDSSLAMLYNAYGILVAADGTAMDPGAVNRGLLTTGFYGELGSKYPNYNGYTPSGDVQPNGAVAFGRNSFFMECIKQTGEVESCLTQSKRTISYKRSVDSFSESTGKAINTELCSGNPVILKVPSKASKAHFVIATAMTVDKNGKSQYIINNPATSGGKGVRIFTDANNVHGYRLYRPAADPDMIFIHLAGDNIDMVVTDPAGRRTGYNPLTQESFSEILGGTYIQAEAIGSPTDTEIATLNESRFEGLQPLSGQYRVQVFAKAKANYQLTSYGFDSTGTINGLTDKQGSLKAGASVQVDINHLAQAIPTRYASLKIKRADFYDSHRNDFAFLQGQIKPIDGHSISTIKTLSVKVGPFNKSINTKDLKKYKVFGHTYYIYIDWGRKGMAFELDSYTGDFALYVNNVDLDSSKSTFSTDLSVQLDNVIAKSLITFKNISRRKNVRR